MDPACSAVQTLKRPYLFVEPMNDPQEGTQCSTVVMVVVGGARVTIAVVVTVVVTVTVHIMLDCSLNCALLIDCW